MRELNRERERETPWDVQKEGEIKSERIKSRERHRGMYKRRYMEREEVRELDIERGTVGCTKGEIWI